MKLRVLFLKKIHIQYFVFTVFILSVPLALSVKRGGNSVFNSSKDKLVLHCDLTGDGNKDTLYVNTEGDKYYIQVQSKDKLYHLMPDKKLNTLGYYYTYNYMKINLIDITRDKTPEIFIQSMEKGSPIQHVFFWNGYNFEDCFCSNNNIMGIIDSKNNRTPKFISGNMGNNSIALSSYMLLESKMEKVPSEGEIPGKAEIYGLINYIQSLPYGEPNKPSDIFYSGVTGKDLESIGKLSAENKIYKFSDGFLSDINFNRNGEAQQYKWVLNFKAKAINQDVNSNSISLTVILKKSPDEGHPFKIMSIVLNNN